MKKKAWTEYLIYILLVIGLVYVNGYFELQSQIYSEKTYDYNYLIGVVSIFVKVLVGGLLGIGYLRKEAKKEGRWKVNLPKMILMVIPAFYFSIIPLLRLIKTEFLQSLLRESTSIFMKNGFTFIIIFQIALGYFLITSFYKQKEDIKAETAV